VSGPLLIYDGDCAFCQRCVDLGARLPAPVRAEPFQLLEFGAFGLTTTQVRAAAWWVAADGSLRRGHRAVAAVLAAQPGPGWRVVGRLIDHPPLSWVAAGGYALIARFRHRLPGGTAQCRVDRRTDRPASDPEFDTPRPASARPGDDPLDGVHDA
jgi:predicted DCC family thiol-disulfide oxidoreductase YuxK